jgi:hypothetical protein
VAALPLASVGQQLQQKSLAVLRVQGWPLKRTLLVVRHADKYVFRALAEFLEVMRTEMKSRLT